MGVFKELQRFTKKSLCLPLFALSTAFTGTAGAQQTQIDYVDAVFAVSYNNAAAGGTAKLTIRHRQDNYDVSFNLKHSLLDASQQASFSDKSCQITPQSYRATTRPALKSNSEESLNFNWTNQTATRQHSKDGNANFRLNQHYYDPMSLYFKARCDLMAGKKQLSYPLIYKGKEGTQKYQVIGTEMVKTGMGEFEALVVQRQRSNKNRRTSFYVAPALDYLIVKIEHRESSLATITMTLKSMDYKLR